MTEVLEPVELQAPDAPYITKTNVLDKGHIILEKYMGNEIDILSNARVSFNSDVAAKTVDELSERDRGVLNFLMRERHGTPWESVVFRFDVKAPLFVFREWHRHRIASINEWSARYSVMEPEWYVPAAEDVRKQVGTPGNYTFEPFEDPVVIETFRTQYDATCRNAFDMYESALEQGIAKELARGVLPVAMYSRMKWTANLRAVLNFLSLRAHEHAQLEIRRFAYAMEEQLKKELPLAMELWDKHGRVAP